MFNHYLVGCRKQRQEKAALDAKCKKVSGLMNGNSKRRMELLEKENRLVF